jgi:hypothetical protein
VEEAEEAWTWRRRRSVVLTAPTWRRSEAGVVEEEQGADVEEE